MRQLTAEWLRQRFVDFNRTMFGGRLPLPLISLCEVSSFVGQYKSKIRVLPDGVRETYDHQLRFSTAFNLTECEIEDTLIHEMIHYFISYNGLQDRTTHGPLFKALMNSINENHGRSISISRRITHGEMTEARANTAKKWHVVAILYFTGGQLGVKVLPRVVPKIIEYYKAISASSNIDKIDLYLHNNPYFNRYPTSTGRRCQAITETEVQTHLRGAHRLEVKGNKIIQK